MRIKNISKYILTLNFPGSRVRLQQGCATAIRDVDGKVWLGSREANSMLQGELIEVENGEDDATIIDSTDRDIPPAGDSGRGIEASGDSEAAPKAPKKRVKRRAKKAVKSK